ncbi:MAG: acylphosphatase [Lachnospiraceae bacterium]|nr:acylphosphatase [Lachnospiraceae bacterium]
MTEIRRKHIVFYGSVQGVGFWYRARQAAGLVGCTGWVRNEWDGSVSMEIQGMESAIDQVILAIERGHYVHIENMDVKELDPLEEEQGFRTY